MSNPECLSTEQHQLIIDHVHLIPPIVNGFMAHDSRRPRVDVESDGHFGLVTAAFKYDPDHESSTPFDAYASLAIGRALYDGARRYFGYTTPRISSLDARNTSLDDTNTKIDSLLGTTDNNPETIFFEKYAAEQTLSILLPRERICLLRYFVDGVDMDTIAAELNLSKSSISRVLSEARYTIAHNKRREKRAGC